MESLSRPTSRQDRALRTRRRMVRAAYDLFCERGYLGTTVADVARAAGVAVPTIYYTFGTKGALLEEAIGAAVMGFDRWRVPPADPDLAEILPWHDWWEDLVTAPTSAAALAVFVDNGVEVLARVAPLMSAIHAASGEPGMAAVLRVNEERRVETYRRVVDIIAAKPGGLREGLTRRSATDIVAVLLSAELYQAVRAGRRWSAARSAGLLRELVSSQLLPG